MPAAGPERRILMRDLNKNEFMKVRRGYENALSLLEDGYVRQALLELKQPIRILEYRGESTKFLALCLQLKARALKELNRPAEAEDCLKRAQAILDKIQD